MTVHCWTFCKDTSQFSLRDVNWRMQFGCETILAPSISAVIHSHGTTSQVLYASSKNLFEMQATALWIMLSSVHHWNGYLDGQLLSKALSSSAGSGTHAGMYWPMKNKEQSWPRRPECLWRSYRLLFNGKWVLSLE